MKNLFTRASGVIRAHKVLSGIVLVLLAFGLWSLSRSTTTTETRYTTALPEKRTIVTSITGSGVISAATESTIKAEASGNVLSLPVAEGAHVVAGQPIAYLDASDARKNVRDAQLSLESARLSLQKLQRPTDTLTLTQAENALARANETKAQADDTLTKSYEDGFTNVSNAFLTMPNVISGLQDALYGVNPNLGTSEQNMDFYANTAQQYDSRARSYRDDAEAAYRAARAAYDTNFAKYKTMSRDASPQDIDALVAQTYQTARLVSDAVKSASDLIQFYQDRLTEKNLTPKQFSNTQMATLSSYTGNMNSVLANLLSVKNTIANAKTSVTSSARSVAEATQSLADKQAGTDTLDLASAQLSLRQRQAALSDAQEALAKSTVRAPFSGVLATLAVHKGDSVGNGSTIGTIITNELRAEITLNEVDIAKVKVGQKATMTFDAIEGLTLTGSVVSVDTLGTTSQGVVSYGVTIRMDVQDARIKPGMSVSAALITETKMDVLSIENAAVKTKGTSSYVQVFTPVLAGAKGSATGVASPTAPENVTVTIGAADDLYTEIISGVDENTEVVIKTTTAAKATTSTTPSLLSAAGVRTPGTGGAGRGQ